MRQQAGIQPPSSAGQQQQQQQGGEQGKEQRWWQRHIPHWQLPAVPWELNTTVVLMVLWGVWFTFAAHTLVPALLRRAGVQLSNSSASQALRHLALDTLQVGCVQLVCFRFSGCWC